MTAAGTGRAALGLASLAVAALALCSCASMPPRGPDQPRPARATEDPAVVSLRSTLAEGAGSILGATQLVVRGRRFSMDCTGVVLAVYWYAGIDLARDFGRYTGNGVSRIFRTLEREGLLYDTAHPLTGDIVFWDNTYDANGNSKWDDSLSHVGMVTAASDDGTIEYIHHNVRAGIVIERMNLLRPDEEKRSAWGRVRILNSPLRLAAKGEPHPPLWLAGQLYRMLGMGYLLPPR
jgi:hypothetical protein